MEKADIEQPNFHLLPSARNASCHHLLENRDVNVGQLHEIPTP
jgi:hypothetical protein